MKIYYLSTARIPDEWAHVFQIMKTCEAFAEAGAEVELVVPHRAQTKAGDPFALAGVKNNFTITYLPALDMMHWRVPFAFNILTLSFFLSFLWYRRSIPQGSVLYVRGELVLPLAHTFGNRIPIVWEAHIKTARMELYRRIFPLIAGVITVTEYYRQELVREYGMPEAKTLCAPDAVDLAMFGKDVSKKEARAKIGLSLDKKIALYTGSDIAWKGLQTLRDAALLLPQDYLVVFMGEIKPDAPDSRKQYVWFKPRIEVSTWLHAADALVLTGTAKSETSIRYTSPLKLFEYMAAARPIVASNLPSFREVLDDTTAYLATPDSPEALAAMIVKAVESPESVQMASRSRILAERYSWNVRAKRILDFIKSR